MLKGIVRLETVDIDTGEITSSMTKENFIFFENYADLWLSNQSLIRPCIIGRGTDVYPYYDKDKNYFGRDQHFMTGYAPTGTQLNKFYQKTEDSPAYWDFYSLFLPPAVVSSIPCIALTTYNSDNYISAGVIGNGNTFYTALNLDPYCYQSPTEYLNVYYRLILVEDEENDSPDFIRNQMVMDIGRGSLKAIFPNTIHKTYPFRIEQDLTRNGYVNFLSGYGNSINNKDTFYPDFEHSKLINAQKTYTYPDANPNQYKQINYGYVNSVIRGTGNAKITSFSDVAPFGEAKSGMFVGVNPIKITPTISENFTGIGNVFSASKTSLIPIFDAANFPAGSGRMQVSGQLTNPNKDAFASTFQAEITKGGQSFNGATYRVYETRMVGQYGAITSYALPLLINGHQWSTEYPKFDTDFKSLQYKTNNSIHFHRQNLVKYIEDRSFITWDKTGITIYDIYHGKLEVFDATTTPSLAVTNVNDVKVDTLGYIWVSCADTGLWRLKIISDTQIELTHIGVLPGSQQKCYAIDVDNFGNVYAIFWGTGLFYTSDGGTTWVNVAIDYPPFSGFESGGFVSKWSYIARMICNPERNATNGVAQLILLMSESSPDWAASGGCWYDFQSQLTTGITNTTLKNQLANARNNRSSENVKISDNDNTWFFLDKSGAGLQWMTYQATLPMSYYINDTMSSYTINLIDKEWFWDNTAGELKEQIILGIPPRPIHVNIGSNKSTHFFDIRTKAKVGEQHQPWDGYSLFYGNGRINDKLGASIKLGKNLYVSHILSSLMGYSISDNAFVVHTGLGFNKECRQWNSVSWGWNGSQWTKNHMGNRPIHSTPGSLFKGAQIKFTDGHAATTSWVPGDTFTFTTFDGYFKDNSSTMALRDTVYYKPTDLNEAFTPNFVTRIDKSSDTGIVNRSPIDLDWDINDLPDTTYSGGSVIINGDPYFGNVSYLALFNNAKALEPSKGEYSATRGTPTMDNGFQILNENSVHLNGESGFELAENNILPLTSTFTIEAMLAPEVTGTQMHLFDFRSATNGVCSFIITSDGKLGVEINGTIYGNTGDFLFPGMIYYVAFTRTGTIWEGFLNGVKQWEFDLNVSMPTIVGLSVFKRWQLDTGSWKGFKGWASNVRITRAVKRDVSQIPTSFFVDFGNTYSGAGLVLKGTYNNGSIISKRELVGNWEVIFRGITENILGTRRSRPKLAFGVSVLKFVESVTDISYRMCGTRVGSFLTPHGNGVSVSNNVISMKITKINDFVNVYVTEDGNNWTKVINEVQDLNPLHHICFWQVQGDTADMITPSVEIVSNGSAIFSKLGAEGSGKGYYNDKFIAADVYYPSDIDISLQGVKATKVRSNYLDPAQPLKGEALALMGGTVVFHPDDLGKAITGKLITIRD